MYKHDITNFMEGSPLVRLNIGEPGWADVYVKVEHFNAGGSVKSRIAKKMVEDAEAKGILKKGMTIIEPTGGNTGMGLALMASMRGFNFIAVTPDNYSPLRISFMKYHNADVRLSDSRIVGSHILMAKDLMEKDASLVCLDQFSNCACVEAHYEGTAGEILKCINPDAFVVSVGTASTFTGVSRRLKEANSSTRCYISQPIGCDIIKRVHTPHSVKGISLGVELPLLDYSLIDGTVEVEFSEVIDILRLLVKKQGLFLGLSSGLNIVAASKIAKTLGTGKKVCTVAPDGGNFYIDDVYADMK